MAVHWADRRGLSSKRPWSRVIGPSGATVTGLARLGWSVVSATQWVDDCGYIIELLQVCPKSVSWLVEQSVHRWTWRALASDHAEMQHLAHGADISVLRGLLCVAPINGWGQMHPSCLEAVVTGASPTQERSRLRILQSTLFASGAGPGNYVHR